MKKQLISVVLIALTLTVNAQMVDYLNANNVNAGIGIGGNLFSMLPDSTWDLMDTTFKFGLLEVPKNLHIAPVFSAGLWMSGLDPAGDTYCSFQRYRERGPGLNDGPVATGYDEAYDSFYRRVFKITKPQITRHQSLGTFVMHQLIDSGIMFWPGKGNPFVASRYHVTIDHPLAPFVDMNADGIYNPTNGDYPAICGDEAVFFVINNDRGKPTEGSAGNLGMEIRGLAEVYSDTSIVSGSRPPEKRAINNTVFVSYEIENRSGKNFRDFYLGLFEDPDLGCFSNDRVGCDTNRNMMFVYNGNTIDPDCNGVKGYGSLKASSGSIFLNNYMSSFLYYTNGTNADTPIPDSCEQYRNYMQGLWNNGEPFTFGGSGYHTGAPTHFIFSGDPNDTTAWSEMTVSNVLSAGDRRMAATIGPVDFANGEIRRFDLAFVTSFDSTATNLTVIDTLKRDADIVQAYYNNNILPCRSGQLTGLSNAPQDLLLTVYPNPATSTLLVDAQQRIDNIELTDMLGRTALTTKAGGTVVALNVGSLQRGVYLLKVQAQSKTAVRRVVLQ